MSYYGAPPILSPETGARIPVAVLHEAGGLLGTNRIYSGGQRIYWLV